MVVEQLLRAHASSYLPRTQGGAALARWLAASTRYMAGWKLFGRWLWDVAEVEGGITI